VGVPGPAPTAGTDAPVGAGPDTGPLAGPAAVPVAAPDCADTADAPVAAAPADTASTGRPQVSQ
jgi:hypothetical protein